MDETNEEFRRAFACVTNQPLNRETLISTLHFCLEPHEQAEVEAHIEALPEATGALQSPFRLMQQLVTAGALLQTDLDADGNPVTDAQKAELSEDELDDLVQGWHYETTDAGRAVVEYFKPGRRMVRLVDSQPTAEESFRKVMKFCLTAHTRDELADFITQEHLLDTLQAVLPKGASFRPSVFADKLEAAGMLAWDGGWQLTEAGRRYLLKN